MTEPQRLDFQLINANTDYIEFVISYVLKEDKWRVDGIGWIHDGSPTYYLRKLRLDSVPANASRYARKALLTKKNMSYKFNNKALEAFTLAQVRNTLQNTLKP